MAWDYYSNPQVRAQFEYEIPLKRIGMPADFANAVLWLAGPAYVTGVNLQVNGGNFLTRVPRPNETEARAQDSGKVLFDREQGQG